MRLLVCGGRDYADSAAMFLVLDRLHAWKPVTEVIHGGAKGADQLAGAWAHSHRLPVTIFQASWATFGNSVGPVRNARMLHEGKPDRVLAFAGGKGTGDMVRQALTAGVLVLRVEGTELSEVTP